MKLVKMAHPGVRLIHPGPDTRYISHEWVLVEDVLVARCACYEEDTLYYWKEGGEVNGIRPNKA